MTKYIERIEVGMTMLKRLLLVLVAAGLFAGEAKGQCSDIIYSNTELMRILNTTGRPGDTVLVPFFLDQDSIMIGFAFWIQFDTSRIKPIITGFQVSDLAPTDTSTFIDIIPAGRFAASIDSIENDADTTSSSTLNALYQQDRKDVLVISYLPPFNGRSDTVQADPAGSVIFYLPFIVDSDLQHRTDTARFALLAEDIISVDTTVFPPDTIVFGGCNAGQLVEVWTNSFLGGVVDRLVYPRPFSFFDISNSPMYFLADTTPPKPTISFTASDSSTASSGTPITLTWSSPNADSLFITENGVRFQSTFPIDGFTSRSPTVNPTEYKLKAFRGDQTDSAIITVTVGGGGGGGGGGNAPIISLTPATSVYTIQQGQTVSFTVTASNPTGGTGNITLQASNVPQNGGLAPTNPIVGVSPVSGTFSFTPDFIQTGTFSVTFSATNNQGTSTSTVVITVQQLPVDRLFSTSAPNQRPVGGLRGTPAVRFPINLITNKTVYGVQFNLTYPPSFLSLDSFNVTDRIPDYVVYDNIGLSPGRVKVVTFGLANEPVVTDTSSAILYGLFTIDSNATPWDRYWLYLDSAYESVDPDPNVPGDTLKVDSGVIDVDSPGDVNLDRTITVADLVNIVGHIIQNVTLNARQFAAGDIVRNDSVNVFDLTADINLIFGGTIATSPGLPVPGPDATITVVRDELGSGQLGTMQVRSELHHQVAAVQMEVRYDPSRVTLGQPKIAGNHDKFVLSYQDNGAGKLRLLLYTLALGNPDLMLQPGTVDLIEVPMRAKTDIRDGDGSVRISEALMSTRGAQRVSVTGVEATLPETFLLQQNYPNPFNPITTIEFSVPASSGTSNVTLDVFNVLGQRVDRLIDESMRPGDYRIEWDATDASGSRVATGIYLYRLSVGDRVESKKMLFLK